MVNLKKSLPLTISALLLLISLTVNTELTFPLSSGMVIQGEYSNTLPLPEEVEVNPLADDDDEIDISKTN